MFSSLKITNFEHAGRVDYDYPDIKSTVEPAKEMLNFCDRLDDSKLNFLKKDCTPHF